MAKPREVTLDPDAVQATIDRLQQRIAERFPGSGLERLCATLADYARWTQESTRMQQRRRWRGRLAIAMAIGGALTLVSFFTYNAVQTGDFSVDWSRLERASVIVGLAQVAVAGGLALAAAAARRRALRHLRDLRAFAHIVDMHQLTKDPGMAADSLQFNLNRYLTYCAEILSMIGKLAVVYADETHDQVVVGEAGGVQSLVASMTQNIYLKVIQTDTQVGAA